MRGLLRGRELGACISQGPQVDALEQRLAAAEQHRRDGNVQFVDQAFAKVLPDRGRAAADAHILSGRRHPCALERLVDASSHEVKGRAAFHDQRCACVVGEHEDRNMVGRAVAPPAFPLVVGPVSTDGAEHVAAQDPGTHVAKAACGEIIVHAARAVVLAEQRPLERACRKQPLVKIGTAHPKRMLQVLIGARSVSVQRDGEAFHANSSHRLSPWSSGRHCADWNHRFFAGIAQLGGVPAGKAVKSCMAGRLRQDVPMKDFRIGKAGKEAGWV